MAEHVNAMRYKIIVYTHTLRKGYVTKSGKRAHEMCCVPSDCVLVARLQILAFASALDSCFSASNQRIQTLASLEGPLSLQKRVITTIVVDKPDDEHERKETDDLSEVLSGKESQHPASQGSVCFNGLLRDLKLSSNSLLECKYCYEILLCASL